MPMRRGPRDAVDGLTGQPATADAERVLMSDHGPPFVVEAGLGQGGGAYVCVDSVGVVTSSESLA
eukprot:4400589-Pyramimonas_sp.AAC.1